MTTHSKIWAIVTFLLFLTFGIAVMVGYVPGLSSDQDAWKGLAIVVSTMVARHGALFSGIGIVLFGACLTSVFLVWGDYLRRSDGGNDGGLGDCGGGGD